MFLCLQQSESLLVSTRVVNSDLRHASPFTQRENKALRQTSRSLAMSLFLLFSHLHWRFKTTQAWSTDSCSQFSIHKKKHKVASHQWILFSSRHKHKERNIIWKLLAMRWTAETNTNLFWYFISENNVNWIGGLIWFLYGVNFWKILVKSILLEFFLKLKLYLTPLKCKKIPRIIDENLNSMNSVKKFTLMALNAMID